MNMTVELRNAEAIARELSLRFAERESRHDAEGVFAAENVADLRDAGLLATNVPREFGGLGATLSETLEVLRILAQGSPSTALMLGMHTSIVANWHLPLDLVPQDQHDFFLAQRRWAYGEAVSGKIFAVANSEPGAGGDVKNSKARISSDGSSLSGLKSFASFGTNADYYMAAARDEFERVDYYVVKNDGVTTTKGGEWDAVGMRSSESVVLRFEAAPVVGVLGYRGLLDGKNLRHWSTLSFTALTIGIAESLFDDVRKSSEGLLQKTELVEFHLQLQASRSMLRHCAASEPAAPSREYKQLVRDAKLFVTRSLAKQASSVFIAQTGRAYARSSSISRKLRDLLAAPALRPPVGITFEEVLAEF